MRLLKGAIFLGLVACAASASALDTIRLYAGKPIPGTVTVVTADQVTIEQGPAKIAKPIAVNEIDTITYDDEPNALAAARTAIRAGDYEAALKSLAKAESAEVKRREIKQDLEYYKGYCQGALALAGAGTKQSRQEAGKLLVEFEKANPTSYHFYDACQMVGDLLVSLENYKQAEAYYDKLAAAPWPEYKMRANVRLGRMLLAQNKPQEALKKFDEVLGFGGDSRDALAQQLAAELGKAEALSASKQSDAAIALIQEVIKKAEPENRELHARAFNVLGNSYLTAGKMKEAHLAFLHVDVLYSGFPEQHAEALGHLATLWQEVYHNTQNANKAKAELKARYPNSRWAQQS